jgi:hypothetical protein
MITVSFRLFCCSMGQARPRWPALARADPRIGGPPIIETAMGDPLMHGAAGSARGRRSRDGSGGLQTSGGWRDPAIQIIGIDG